MSKFDSAMAGFVILLALQLLFLLLRMVGVTHWPWLWVFSPIWVPLAASLLTVMIAVAWVVIEERRALKK